MAIEKPGPPFHAHSHTHPAEAAAPAPTKAPPKQPAPPPTPPHTNSTTPTVLPTSTAPNSTTIATTLTTTSTQNQSISASPSNAIPSQEVGSPPANKSHTGLIAGAAAGAIILFVLIAGLLFRAKRRRDRESREAELYQQRAMMHKYSEGSSSMGYGDESDLPLHRNFYGQPTLLSKQPDWFTKKSPLEYYKQIPTLEELKRQKQQQLEEQQLEEQQLEEQQLEEQQQHQRQQGEGRQQQLRPYPLKHGISDASSTSNSNSSYSTSSSTTFAQKGASMAARSLSPSNTDYSPAGEAIALSPTSVGSTYSYQKHQFQHPRISTQGLRRPSSPAVSPFSGSTAKNPYTSSSPMSPYSLSSSTLASTPTYQGVSPPPIQFPTNGLHNYTPPPPISGPFSPVSPSSLPSTGFYDSLDLGEDRQTSHSNSRVIESPVSPPPIPRSTRPISVASASSIKFLSTDSQPEDFIPAVPALPQVASLPQSP